MARPEMGQVAQADAVEPEHIVQRVVQPERNQQAVEERVYPGADGSFTLYEDEFDNYNYEDGAYTEIPLSWDEASRTLTIGARKGAYDGMLKSRRFVVDVPGGKSKTVNYTGRAVTVKL